MDDRMKVIREAFEKWWFELGVPMTNRPAGYDFVWVVWSAALDSLEKLNEPVSNQILTMLREERDAYAEENERLKKKLAVGPSEESREWIDTALSESWGTAEQKYDRDKLAALITARDERIKAEERKACADRLPTEQEIILIMQSRGIDTIASTKLSALDISRRIKAAIMRPEVEG